MSKHTPGPWEVKHYVGSTLVRTDTDKDEIADIYRTVDSGDHESNAYIIAAAPELLEALLGLLQHIDFVTDECLCSAAVEATYARAAIAKARGES